VQLPDALQLAQAGLALGFSSFAKSVALGGVVSMEPREILALVVAIST